MSFGQPVEAGKSLTPYDTGKRAEPKVWLDGIRAKIVLNEDHAERFGKVDFTDDTDATVATIWLDRPEGSDTYVVHVEQHLPVSVLVEVFD